MSALRTLVLVILLAAVRPDLAIAFSEHFESPHVHPVEISPDGTRLFVVHTADHKLSVFDLTSGVPVRIGQVFVGMEPVSVRARTDDEVWVVNHVSDSISLVKPGEMNVVRTLLVGDEPTDVAFANGGAFVCVSQEDRIRVYDVADLDAAPTDIPLTMSDPRSLALSPDGTRLYVGALDGQNETTAVPFPIVEANGGPPAPTPPMSGDLPAAPDVALIVRHDGTAWRDEAGTSWSPFVGYTLLDHDVLRIDTASRAVTGHFRGVGTTLFNLGVNPVTGMIYASNQEATNEIRFEPNLRGRFVFNRVTTIDPGSGIVTPKHLNPHIDYGAPAGNPTERALSLSIPTDIAVSSDGQTVYVAAMGSAKVGVLDAAGNVTRRIDAGEGPTGLALDEPRNLLYVVNRFPSTLSVVDLDDDSRVDVSLGFDPSDPSIVTGRRFLYDGESSSAHGNLSCASCHVFGAMDNISWDLGDPTGTFVENAPLGGFHPMKGPMATQSLKGLSGTEPLHWRGDRNDFQAFNGAFPSLLGRSTELSPGDMQAFEDFVLTMKYAGNPNRDLDGTHLGSLNGADPAHGESLFETGNLVGGLDCVSCHAFPTGENGLIIPAAALQEDQDMVVPQLRNLYEKTRFDDTAGTNVRGFGYTHDGAVDDLFSFLDFPGFNFQSTSDQEDVAAFLLAFPGDVPTAVGAQWTMDGTNEAAGIGRVSTLVALADANEIGLIAKGRDGAAENRGWVYLGSDTWDPDRALEPDTNLASLLALAGAGREITFTAVIEGHELQLGVDQDADGFLDRDEIDVGSDPGDPGSTPNDAVGVAVVAPVAGHGLWLTGANPTRTETRLGFRLPGRGAVRLDVYDVTGRRVRTLLDEPAHREGTFEQAWDLRDGRGRAVATGHYFVRLVTPGGVAGQRVVVLR